ncbi:hypothetical protein DL93DRAFT_2079612 [Clavulina sp. PMI_390]|nr:hypothetical protein DL93DRAFT_2079612 [Clavulina sp. PMI_390]
MASIASTQSAMVFAKNALSAMRKKALQAFEPLLPDEIPVQVGDTLSLMQQFDDGWCVVAVEAADDHTRPGSAGKGGSATAGEIKMGCVPLWVFERKSKVPGEHMRSMRSTSLAVTVELTASDPAPGPGGRGDGAAPWMREPLYSWSNF